VDLADRHSLALLNRILADGGCVARPPGQEVHPCDQEPDREADEEAEQDRWHVGLLVDGEHVWK